MSRERIGRYELVSQIATGGMGMIYLGRTKGLGGFERHVVIKTLELAGDDQEQLTAMFLDEARLLGVLHHQHIAPVLEINDDDGRMYIAMEYIHGKTAADVWNRTNELDAALPIDFCLTVVSAAASGLHYAHTRRGPDGQPLHIVHRDVSLSNVMIGFDGAVKLIDFGIAKAANRRVKTQTGFVKGKIGYMAPEQVRRQEVDPRTDVFALGIVLYELTTMTRAFREDSERMTLERIKIGSYRMPSEIVPEYPKELERIVTRALRVDPRERFPDAESMRASIEALGHKYDLLLGDAAVAEIMHQLFEDRREPWQRLSENKLRPETSLDVALEVTNDSTSVPAIGRVRTPLRTATDAADALGRELAAWAETIDAGSSGSDLAPPPKGAFDDDQATAIAPAALPREAFPDGRAPAITLGPPPAGIFDDNQETAIANVDVASTFATNEVTALPDTFATNELAAIVDPRGPTLAVDAISDELRRSTDAADTLERRTDDSAVRAAKISRLFTESSFNPTDTPAKPIDSIHSGEPPGPAGRAIRSDDTEGALLASRVVTAKGIGDIGGIASLEDTGGVTILPATAGRNLGGIAALDDTGGVEIMPAPVPPKNDAAAKQKVRTDGSSKRILWIALVLIALGGIGIGVYMFLNRAEDPATDPVDPRPAADAVVATIDAAATTLDTIAIDAAETAPGDAATAALDAAPGTRIITVKITTTPPGATVALDGTKRLGKTPFEGPVDVPTSGPQPHSLKVRMMGFNTVKIDIGPDDKTVERDITMIRIPPPKKEEPKDDEDEEKPRNKSKLELPED